VEHGQTKDDITATEYQGEVHIALNSSWEIGDLNDRWEQFKDSVAHAANEALGDVECKNLRSHETMVCNIRDD